MEDGVSPPPGTFFNLLTCSEKQKKWRKRRDFMPNEIVLSMKNISKTFPGVRALDHVDFTLRSGV